MSIVGYLADPHKIDMVKLNQVGNIDPVHSLVYRLVDPVRANMLADKQGSSSAMSPSANPVTDFIRSFDGFIERHTGKKES